MPTPFAREPRDPRLAPLTPQPERPPSRPRGPSAKTILRLYRELNGDRDALRAELVRRYIRAGLMPREAAKRC